jgi:hypothetical protein
MKTKKLKILLSVLFLFSMFFTNAQNVGIGDREFVPNTSAILDLQSSSKGVLVPRVTMAQRLYISVNPQTEGLLVYQTDQDNGFYYYDGMIWQHLQISITNSNGEVIIPGLPTLATVATTGSFNDLVDKPTIPVYLVDLEQDLNYAMYVTRAEKEGWTAKSNFSGYYNDLIEKPQFSTVATSGSYTDLQNKPTVPTNLLELQQDPNYAMYVTRAEKEGWTAKADVSQIPVSLLQLQQDNNYAMYVTRAEKEAWQAKSNFSGSYNDLMDKPTFTVDLGDGSIQLATVALTGKFSDLVNRPTFAPIATSGSYNDLTDKPTFNVTIGDSNVTLATVAITGAYADLQGAPLLKPVAITGDYNDLYNKPSFTLNFGDGDTLELSPVAFTGSYNDLINKPSFEVNLGNGQISLATVALTGNYSDLNDRPNIPTKLLDLEQDNNYAMYVTRAEKEAWSTADFSGSWNDLTDKPTYALVAQTNSYYSLDDRPTIPTNLLDLQQDQNYAMYVTRAEKDAWTAKSNFSGNYADLQNKPTIPTALADLTQDSEHKIVSGDQITFWNNGITQMQNHIASDVNVQPDWAETSPSMNSFIKNKPNFANVATSGSYTDLTNTPTIPTLPTLATVATSGSYDDLQDKPTAQEIVTNITTNTTNRFVSQEQVTGLNSLINIFANSQTGLVSSVAGGDLIGNYPAPTIKEDVYLQGNPKVDNRDFSSANVYTRVTSSTQQKEIANLYDIKMVVEAYVEALLPVGTVIMWSGNLNQIPCGWELYEDMVGRFPVGAGQVAGNGLTQYAKGTTGGEEKHELTSQEMPSHNHQIGEGWYNNAANNSSSGKLVAYEQHSSMGNTAHPNTPMYSWDTGGDVSKNTVAHENRPPYYGIFYIIKTSEKCVKTGSTIQVIN